jgi:hypothetical protein
MKKYVCYLALFAAGSTFAASPAPVLSSQFSGVSQKTHHIFTIKQNPSGTWRVEEFLGCETYPCSIQERTVVKEFTPIVTSQLNMADSNLEIQLGTDFKIVNVNDLSLANGSKEPYWKMTITSSTDSEEIRLDFDPLVLIKR